MTDEKKDQTPGKPEPEPEDGERPPRAALLFMVAFPFGVMALIGLLYVWLRG